MVVYGLEPHSQQGQICAAPLQCPRASAEQLGQVLELLVNVPFVNVPLCFPCRAPQDLQVHLGFLQEN